MPVQRHMMEGVYKALPYYGIFAYMPSMRQTCILCLAFIELYNACNVNGLRWKGVRNM